MTKTISPELDAHLDQEVTTLARCWNFTRLDGVNFYFTDHDVDLLFEGNTYVSANGFNASAVANNAGLSVDNLDIDGFFDDSSLTEQELRAGVFDYAQVRIFYVNYEDLTQGNCKMKNGRLGEVIFTQHGFFHAELRGIAQALQQQIGELYSPECRADLGDLRCKVQLYPSFWIQNHTYKVGEAIRVPTASGSFSDNRQYENRIYKVTTAGTTGDTIPTFDPTPGAETSEGGIQASDVLTFLTQPADSTHVTLNDRVYQFQTTLTNVNGNVHIGATLADSVDNLIAAVNNAAGSGTKYAAATTANLSVSAVLGAGTSIVFTALAVGTDGNDILAASTVAGSSFATDSFTGGTDAITWTATEAFVRDAAVTVVTDRAAFQIDVTESRAADNWFNGGLLTFTTGLNTGKSIEIKDWTATGGHIEMYLPFGYTPAVGDLCTLYPGCDKTVPACRDKFDNIINMHAEPYLPGQDQALAYPDAKG